VNSGDFQIAAISTGYARTSVDEHIARASKSHDHQCVSSGLLLYAHHALHAFGFVRLGFSGFSTFRFTISGTIKIAAILAAPFEWFFLKTPKDGAQCPLYLALSPKVDGVSGKYFSCVSLISRRFSGSSPAVK